MAVNFPTSLDTLTNPTATDYLNSPSHAGQHANANDILEALEAKVGIDGSAVTTSHAFLLAGLGAGISVKAYVDAITRYSNLSLATGQMINGKIVVTVTSNNITLALKGADGNDPSASNPVYCKIGGVIRSVTAARSVTKNAATNWMNAGSSELATKEIDYFAYLGYNATDGVTLGFSRIPFACQYSDFSTTTTNEKYAAISTITNAAATDYYNVIGRFAATLSAGAGYTWSVPTYTAINLIQRPIWETRWLSLATLDNRYKYDEGTLTIKGWNFIQISGTAGVHGAVKAITFPMTFASVPSILVTPLGFRNNSNPTVITDLGTSDGATYAVSQGHLVTGFSGGAGYIDAVLANTYRIGFVWEAKGKQ
jgi:hypothetical protein